MVNGSRYYTALESVSVTSGKYTALTIYPCQIRAHQRWQSKLQLPTARKKEWRPAKADSSPQAVTWQHCDTHYFSRPQTHNLPIVCWPDALPVVPPSHQSVDKRWIVFPTVHSKQSTACQVSSTVCSMCSPAVLFLVTGPTV